MEDSEHIDLDNNGFNLIDFSSENDNLFFIVSPISHQPKSAECQGDSTRFETAGDTDSGNVNQGNDQIETVPQLAQSGEPQRIRSGKCNLRKSLAWDNAFFTSAGVLDPEELTSMMDGREAVHKQFLPGIQEDMQRSTDSISTLESDNFTLECLEAELFEDIRASIQKSSKSAKGSFGTKAIVQGGDKDISSPNRDTVSQNQLKSIPVIKKATAMHKIGVPKCQPKANTGIQGSTKSVKPESSLPVVPKSAVKSGELASSIAKPPKGTSKSSSTTPGGTKLTSMPSGHLKAENTNAKTVPNKGSHASKMTSSNGLGRVLPKPASTLQSSSRESSTAKSQPKTSTKGASCGSTSSEDRVKPPSATVTRKTPPKTVNSPSPRATPQPSSKNSLKNKAKAENSAISAYLMSTKVTENISPASSVSEWSSASSSSSAVNQKSNKSRSSFGSSSCRSLDGDALPLNLKTHADQITHRQEIKRSTESIRKPSSQTGVVSGSTSMKPTGLRMPSPKIGFFDGVKSLRASNGAMQSPSGLPVVSPKVGSGVSPRGITNIKPKVRKLPLGRVSAARKHETKRPDAPSQGNSQVTPCIGDHEKMDESNENMQENGSEELNEIGPKENLHVIKNEIVLGDNQDFCSEDAKLVDPEHNDSKTEMAPLPSQGNSQVTPCIAGHEKMVESNENMQENGSEKHNEVGPKENLMVLGNNQDFCSGDVKFVDSERTDSKTESCGPINKPERLDALKLDGNDSLGNRFNSCKIDEKENVPFEGRMDQSSKDEGVFKICYSKHAECEPLPPATCS